MKKFYLGCIFLLYFSEVFSQTTVNLFPQKDNTIFSESNTLSGGKSVSIYVGRVARGLNVRRGLIKFDVSSIPQNAQIQSVALSVATVKAAGNAFTPHNFTLHKVLSDWGEGTSVGLGSGANATTNDATWSKKFHPNTNWTNLGGDFVSLESATAVGIYEDFTVWSSNQMKTDVLGWINSPSSNFGWLIKGEENVEGSAKAFSSKDGLQIYLPKLTIIYSIPLPEKVIINELNPQKKWVELYNPTNATINLSDYWLANGNNTIQINNSIVLNGNLSFEASKYIVLNWANIDPSNGELALYNGNPASGGTLMKDYIQYGSANQQRASSAVSASVWDNASAFLNTIQEDTLSYSLNGNNIYPTGESTNSVDYLTQHQTPSLRNLVCPSSISLIGNIIDAKYTTTGLINLNGNLSNISKVKLIANQAITIQNLSIIPNGAIFEAKIGGCGSN